MSESGELYTTVNYIKNKVNALEKIEMLNLRSNKELRNEYVSLLSGDSLLFEIYKAINGVRAQKEILGHILVDWKKPLRKSKNEQRKLWKMMIFAYGIFADGSRMGLSEQRPP